MSPDPFMPADRFSVELSGPVEVTSTITAGIPSVTVTQGPARWTVYDLASLNLLVDAFARAAVELEILQAERGECGVCGLPDRPLCDTVPKWINDGDERVSVARCFDCTQVADARSAA